MKKVFKKRVNKIDSAKSLIHSALSMFTKAANEIDEANQNY